MKISFFAAILAGLLSVSSTVSAEIREHKFRMSFTTTAESYLGVGSQDFADRVNKKSNGKITIKLFPNGVLGGEIQMLSSLRGGTVEATGLSAGLLISLVKEFGLFDLPYLFDNEKEAAEVINGPFGRRLTELLAEKNLIALGYWGVDYRNLTNNRRPVTKLEDIKGLKVRVLQSPIYLDFWNALGANTVPMPFGELYTALEQKIVDGQENPYAAIESAKLDEVQPYLSLTRHVYFVGTAVFSKLVWDKLNDDERKLIQEAANEAMPVWHEAAVKESTALAKKLQNKMKFNEISKEELARIKAVARPVVEKYIQGADPLAVKYLFESIEKVRGKSPR
jgi:tripartite ATP-independent transporter DctP family solute receptor